MPDRNDKLTILRARRGDLYGQLQHMDHRVAESRRSPFFGTCPGDETEIRNSIERVEGQIGDVDRQIADIRGRNG